MILGYRRPLDGIRAVAVTMVIAAHVAAWHSEGGVIGVDVFFALSGFLITTLLLEEHAVTSTIDLRAFYLRRALRLFPALAVVVVATDIYMALDVGNGSRTKTLSATPSVIFYVANWQEVISGPTALGWFGHLWSLAVEEQFYFAWPLVLIFVLRRRWSFERIAVALGVCCVLSVVARHLGSSWSDGGGRFGTPMIADQLLYGCTLAVALKSSWRQRLRRATSVGLPLSVAFIAAYVGVAGVGHAQHIDVAFVGIASAVVIGAVVEFPNCLLARLLAHPVAVYLGRISYGMYLWHILVCFSLSERIHFGHRTHPVYWIVGYGMTVTVASISYRYIEQPALRMKNRMKRTPSGQPATASA